MNEFPTIKDKNICTARLLFETPDPACCDTVARWCVSHHGVWSIQPFSQEIEIVASLQLCNLPDKELNASSVKHVLVSLSRRFIWFLLSLASLSKSRLFGFRPSLFRYRRSIQPWTLTQTKNVFSYQYIPVQHISRNDIWYASWNEGKDSAPK